MYFCRPFYFSMTNRIFLFIFSFVVLIFGSTFQPHSEQVVQKHEVSQTDTFELSLLFIGDIMQHEPQIRSAWDNSTKTYSYDHCFKYVREVFDIADLTIANLEFTFGGKPYTGYPMFSAPVEIGHAVHHAGIDVLMLANNHSCDRGKRGILNTIHVVDSMGIPRTGTFRDSLDRQTHHPLIIEKNGFRIALLNYTYDTNGLPIPKPTIVNLIDTALIRKDIQYAKTLNPDEIIVFYHWGYEYERLQNKQQEMLAKLCHDNGARIVIGSHPHVIQPMQRFRLEENPDVEVAVAYSLGNFVSNQRRQYRDGGAMVYLKLKKYDDIVEIAEMAHILVWVWTPTENGKQKYYIVPVSRYEHHSEMFDPASLSLFRRFRDDSRGHLSKNNVNVNEMIWDTLQGHWQIPK
jgi:hypothetical protein